MRVRQRRRMRQALGHLGRPCAEGWSARSDDQSKGIRNTIRFQLKNLKRRSKQTKTRQKWCKMSEIWWNSHVVLVLLLRMALYCNKLNKSIYSIHPKAAVPYSGISKSQLALMPRWNEKAIPWSDTHMGLCRCIILSFRTVLNLRHFIFSSENTNTLWGNADQ